MEQTAGGYGDQVVAVLSAAVELLESLPLDLHRLTGADLDAVLPVVDRLTALGEGSRFSITREADTRGEVNASQEGSTRMWVRQRCAGLEDAQAGQVAKAVRELRADHLAPEGAAVSAGRVSVAAACAIASEFRALGPMLSDGAEAAVVDGYVAIARSQGRAGVRRLRPAMLARYGLGELLQREQDKRAYLTSLSGGVDLGGGLSEYRLRLDAPGAAALEAAIGPLSAPVPGDDGLRDGRTADRRRGEALVQVCRRATALAPVAAPSGLKATVFVTVGLDDLRSRIGTGAGIGGGVADGGVRPGTVLGGLGSGMLLGPETVRRLACDAQVIPTVMGSRGEILELGRAHRLFTRPQVNALVLRDRGCTFPGCDTPAHWCDAHHLTHWADGGISQMANAALLCGRHHTIVHRDRLAGVLRANSVTWDTVPGSYYRALARSTLGDDDPNDHRVA